jgi:adenylate cyclase
LEGANKAFGTATMIAESTWEQTAGAMAGREIGRLRVVGRSAPVRVFEPLPPGCPMSTEQLQSFQQGLNDCREGRWAAALEAFSTLNRDPVAKMYAERCRTLLADPVASWDGIWNLTQK